MVRDSTGRAKAGVGRQFIFAAQTSFQFRHVVFDRKKKLVAKVVRLVQLNLVKFSPIQRGLTI